MNNDAGGAMKIMGLGMAGILSVASVSAVAAEAKDSVTLGVNASYFEGNYGTTTTTKVWYVPVSLAYKTGDWRFKMTVPYLSVDGESANISGTTIVRSRSNQRSGLGDTWLEAKYHMANALGKNQDLSPYFKLKLDTAQNGLGSGEKDAEAGLSFDLMTSATVFPFAQVGYRVVGSPAGKTYDNTWSYSAGVTFKIADNDYLTPMYAGRQSQQAAYAASSDAILAWNHNFDRNRGIQIYYDKGLSDGSPDYGIGVGGTYRF